MNHPKTSVTNNQLTLPNIMEQQKPQLCTGVSLKSLILIFQLHTLKLETQDARLHEINTSICAIVLNQITVISEWDVFRHTAVCCSFMNPSDLVGKFEVASYTQGNYIRVTKIMNSLHYLILSMRTTQTDEYWFSPHILTEKIFIFIKGGEMCSEFMDLLLYFYS